MPVEVEVDSVCDFEIVFISEVSLYWQKQGCTFILQSAYANCWITSFMIPMGIAMTLDKKKKKDFWERYAKMSNVKTKHAWVGTSSKMVLSTWPNNSFTVLLSSLNETQPVCFFAYHNLSAKRVLLSKFFYCVIT